METDNKQNRMLGKQARGIRCAEGGSADFIFKQDFFGVRPEGDGGVWGRHTPRQS